MIEWDSLVLECRRKSVEVNPRACIITNADIVLAMAAEIDRLRACAAGERGSMTEHTRARLDILAASGNEIARESLDEIDRLRQLNTELASAIKQSVPHWERYALCCNLIARVEGEASA